MAQSFLAALGCVRAREEILGSPEFQVQGHCSAWAWGLGLAAANPGGTISSHCSELWGTPSAPPQEGCGLGWDPWGEGQAPSLARSGRRSREVLAGFSSVPLRNRLRDASFPGASVPRGAPATSGASRGCHVAAWGFAACLVLLLLEWLPAAAASCRSSPRGRAQASAPARRPPCLRCSLA